MTANDDRARRERAGDLARYGFLRQLDAEPRERLLSSMLPLASTKGAILLGHGDACEGIVMLSRGALRVYRAAPDGREISLYRVEAGEMCVLALCAVLGGRDYAATAAVAEDVRGYVVPAAVFGRLFDAAPPLRRYVMEMFATRLQEVMFLVSEVAFARMDQRLAKLLATRCEVEARRASAVAVTHHEIADELGTAREVVSRILRSFADQGLVSVARGQVTIIDPAGLRDLFADLA